MSSKSDRNKGAGSGVAMSAGDATQDLQPIRFGSAESEAQVRSLLSKADTMRVRVRLADEQDVEGHLFGGGDTSLVLALALSGDDDDVEGHAISIHFPDAEQARRFRNELLAAGVLTATLAMGVGTGIALAPHQTGTAAAPASQATVFMDTQTQAREGAITQSGSLAIPVGSASDIAQKAQAAESVTGPALKSQVGSQSKGATTVNPSAAADAARTEAGVTGSLAGSTTGTAGNPAAAADAARTQAGITGSLAGSSTGSDTSTRTREAGALSESNPVAAGDAARTQAGITGSLAGSSTGDASTKVREGGALSETAVNPAASADAARAAAGITGSLAGSSTARETPAQQINDEIAAARVADQTGAAASAAIPQGASALSAADQINAEIAAAQASAQAGAAAIPQGASALSAADQIKADIAAAQAAATPAADAQTQAREGGALSQASATPTPKVDYSGKPLPPEPTSSSPTSSPSPTTTDAGKPLPPLDKS